MVVEEEERQGGQSLSTMGFASDISFFHSPTVANGQGVRVDWGRWKEHPH